MAKKGALYPDFRKLKRTGWQPRGKDTFARGFDVVKIVPVNTELWYITRTTYMGAKAGEDEIFHSYDDARRRLTEVVMATGDL